MLYRIVRPLLFALDAETSHRLALGSLQLMHRLGLHPRAKPETEVTAAGATTVMGLTFPNPVGLAAGLDKNGEYIDALASLGFGFIEIGTVTPRPQPGNPRPRLFRIPQAEAIINRMGFNNGGIECVLRNVERARYRGILGINIGKNFDTPIERAVDDYLLCLDAVFPHASYITVNISSPNTKNLRDLQSDAALEELLTRLKNRRDRLAIQHERRVPLVLKIAPDLDAAQVQRIAALLLKHQIDGVIATNTTIARDAVAELPHGEETGGLSGAPVEARSTEVVAELYQALQGKIPIIGVGGIRDVVGMRRKLAAGASLIQVYTGLIYRGPALVRDLVRQGFKSPRENC